MTTAHEARPHGVPEYWDWAKKPRIGRREAPTGWTAFTAWGQLYRCAGSLYDHRRTVQVRDLQAWFLVGDTWKRAQRPSALEGSAFAEDYARPAVSARVVGSSRHGTTVRLRRGYNFHFWPGTGRVAFDAKKVDAVAVLARARLTRRGTREGCVALSVGADYWRSLRAPAAGSENTVDAGIGRFKRVTRRWRAFGMTNASDATLAAHPLPLRLPQGELR